MGISLDVFQALPQGGFTFNVLGACKAEKVNLSEACTIQFSNNNGTYKFQSIGNVTKGSFHAEPGIVGVGVCVIFEKDRDGEISRANEEQVWLATAYTLLIIIAVLGVVFDDLGPRWMFRRVQKRDSRYVVHFIVLLDDLQMFHRRERD